MPVTTWLTARNSVALPRVCSQLTFGILRRKMAPQARRHPRRSSSQFPIRVAMSAPLNEQLIVFHLDLVAIQRSRRRAGQHLPIFVKHAVVARAEELPAVGDPAHPHATG